MIRLPTHKPAPAPEHWLHSNDATPDSGPGSHDGTLREAGDQGVYLATTGRPHEGHRARVHAGRLRCLPAPNPTAGAPARLRSRAAVPGPTTQPETGSSAAAVTLPPPYRIFLPGTMPPAPSTPQRISCPGHPVSRRRTNDGIYTGAAQSWSPRSLPLPAPSRFTISYTSGPTACGRSSSIGRDGRS
jgi:hypothetical protein